jgi:polyhydroxyalkanoate synthase subunit PhaC
MARSSASKVAERPVTEGKKAKAGKEAKSGKEKLKGDKSSKGKAGKEKDRAAKVEAPARVAAAPAAEAAPVPKPETIAPKPVTPRDAPRTTLDALQETDVADLAKLSQNLAEAVMVTNRALADSLQARMARNEPSNPDPFGVQPLMARAAMGTIQDAVQLGSAQMALTQRMSEIFSAFSARAMSGGTEAAPAVKDKRFKDEEWTTNPVFALMRDVYLATSQWMVDLVAHAPNLTDEERAKAAFFARQAVDAASPSNFVMTNPRVLRETLATGGANLVRGAEHFAEDLARGGSRLAISQVDGSQFKVGENIAITPGKVIWRNDLVELIQYTPTTDKVHEVPLLIFPPWINKFYILDLGPKNSMVKWLTEQGFTVLVASWVNPDATLAARTFESYLADGLSETVDAARRLLDVEQVNTVGYCIGGTLLASGLARAARDGDSRIKSATFFAAQADFEEAGDLKVFVDDAGLQYLDELTSSTGVLNAGQMADTFNALRANDLIWNYVVENYYMGKDPPPFDLLYWNSDQTRMPKALHMFYLKRFYRENALARGRLELDGRRVNLGDVTVPIYVQSSREDHIAPARSVYRMARLFGGPTRFMMAGSGHIAGVINPPSANKYQHWTNDALPATLPEWQQGALEHPGSWWGDWATWLGKLSGRMIPARDPAKGKVKPLCDAPGTYVLVKSEP